MIGAPDEKWGEAVTAVIETKPGRAVAEDEIYRLVRERLGGVHAPKVVQVWPELPRSSNGKVLKSEVRKAFWADRERAV